MKIATGFVRPIARKRVSLYSGRWCTGSRMASTDVGTNSHLGDATSGDEHAESMGTYDNTDAAGDVNAVPVTMGWLERDVGRAPGFPTDWDKYRHREAVGEMLRPGAVLQSVTDNSATREVPDTKHSTKDIEDALYVERIRPSLLTKPLGAASNIVGGLTNLTGNYLAAAWTAGSRTALSEYYNDQIRRIHEIAPNDIEAKEVLKELRNRELERVDELEARHPGLSDAKALRDLSFRVAKVLNTATVMITTKL